MNAKETKGYNFITGETNSGTVKVELDDQTITLELMQVNSSMDIRAKAKSAINVSISTEVEAKVSETFATRSVRTNGRIRAIEKKAEKKMEQMMNTTIQKAQNEWKADFIGIGRNLHKHHYGLWQKVRKDWDRGDNFFAKASIDAAANVTIHSTGAADQTKQ